MSVRKHSAGCNGIPVAMTTSRYVFARRLPELD